MTGDQLRVGNPSLCIRDHEMLGKCAVAIALFCGETGEHVLIDQFVRSHGSSGGDRTKL